MKIAVVGGGAAGFFAAINAAEISQNEIVIIEGSDRILTKVKVSGGGRCNVTNGSVETSELANCYPRGKNSLKKVFSQFTFNDTVSWFKERGVNLRQEKDGRIFPVSNSSQTIIDCLVNSAVKSGVKIKNGFKVSSLGRSNDGFELSNGKETLFFDKVIVTTGGHAKLRNYDWLEKLHVIIEPPVPSLFTFNIKNKELTTLMGVSVKDVQLRIRGTKLVTNGDVLITHWGLSGPAILKLSAFGARDLNSVNYKFVLLSNWVGGNEDAARKKLNLAILENTNKNITNRNPFSIAAGLWEYLLKKAGIDDSKTWNQLGKKDVNRLANALINDEYQVEGKSIFKEEFVTCGGVKESEVDFRTMECRKIKGLFFAGEILNIDGITGGFNFQAAWSTGFVAGINSVKD